MTKSRNFCIFFFLLPSSLSSGLLSKRISATFWATQYVPRRFTLTICLNCSKLVNWPLGPYPFKFSGGNTTPLQRIAPTMGQSGYTDLMSLKTSWTCSCASFNLSTETKDKLDCFLWKTPESYTCLVRHIHWAWKVDIVCSKFFHEILGAICIDIDDLEKKNIKVRLASKHQFSLARYLQWLFLVELPMFWSLVRPDRLHCTYVSPVHWIPESFHDNK